MLGKIKDLEIDTLQMKLSNLVVEVEKQVAKEVLGKIIVIHHAKARIPASLVESTRDAIILKQPIDESKGSIETIGPVLALTFLLGRREIRAPIRHHAAR